MADLERQYLLNAVADYFDYDAIHARRQGQFDRANALAELSHQLRNGRVVKKGELKMLEALYDSNDH